MFLVTFPTVYWPVFTRFEGYFTFLITIRTNRLVHFSFSVHFFQSPILPVLRKSQPMWAMYEH